MKTLSLFTRKIGSLFIILSRKIDTSSYTHLNDNWIKKSYSQCGEDLIIDYLASVILKIDVISYIDIGAMHPCIYSNTYRFYEMGNMGVCIEANPNLIQDFVKYRPNDEIINAGVVGEKTEKKLNFFILNDHSLSTLNKEEALASEKIKGNKIVKTIEINTIDINSLLKKSIPTFITIDIEGLDFEVIKSINFNKYKIPILCIETIDYITQEKKQELIEYICNQGYSIYADTKINTIFIRKSLWDTYLKNKIS